MDRKALPLVTINIPTYNQQGYIARAIESCLAQDYSNLEIVVSDDCSTDNTYHIAKKFESNKVRVHQTPQNSGRVKNYRYALYELAKGEWVANLDGDDYYNDAAFISIAVKQLSLHPSCVMYVGGAATLDEPTGKIQQAPIFLKENITGLKGTDYVLNFYKYGQVGQHFAVLYNRALALETDFYILDSLGSDTDSICRLALKGDVLVQKKWVGVWTSHGANVSYTLDMTGVEKELKMLEHIGEAARRYLPAATVEKWLAESKRLKYKQALYASLPSLSFG
ncbi:MAG TPA: glycosyltransferase family A protein, partial [Chitinophagaceae bacterium]|nr:glycosyltransferase family A protein [Chitinophagaceae bacterium]